LFLSLLYFGALLWNIRIHKILNGQIFFVPLPLLFEVRRGNWKVFFGKICSYQHNYPQKKNLQNSISKNIICIWTLYTFLWKIQVSTFNLPIFTKKQKTNGYNREEFEIIEG